MAATRYIVILSNDFLEKGHVNIVPTDSSNQTTAYTYDGDNNLTSETAVMPSGETSETTDYLYGVSTTTGSAIDDNDLLYQVQYPDPTTGEASSSQAETYSYDALGDTLTYTDRNGMTHADGYDPSGNVLNQVQDNYGELRFAMQLQADR